MNDRERFQAIMHYRPVDRGIIQDFSYWDETVMAWREYGLPRDVGRITPLRHPFPSPQCRGGDHTKQQDADHYQ